MSRQYLCCFFILSFYGYSRFALANYLTGTAFPFEGCLQQDSLSLYSAQLISYNLITNSTGQVTGSTSCFQVSVRNQTECRIANGVPTGMNTTHCCDVGFNKFKFYPNQNCRGAARSATAQEPGGLPYSIPFTYQTMPASPVDQWVWKLTNLQKNPTTAQGLILCMTFGDPCPTMQDWSYNPNVMEFGLYNEKGSAAYECCPAGKLNVPLCSFGLNNYTNAATVCQPPSPMTASPPPPLPPPPSPPPQPPPPSPPPLPPPPSPPPQPPPSSPPPQPPPPSPLKASPPSPRPLPPSPQSEPPPPNPISHEPPHPPPSPPVLPPPYPSSTSPHPVHSPPPHKKSPPHHKKKPHPPPALLRPHPPPTNHSQSPVNSSPHGKKKSPAHKQMKKPPPKKNISKKPPLAQSSPPSPSS
ncbi:hypothetical protein CEUSTIGMA_g12659.t1 [Chlamydomonas eustigma]|uniref:Pherophorin domain-containing protein n=1 Tax=Chlamydomonas eustigma TaxID=1157962 RepID=A0A250XQK6_9CHLO|nr:hypothetical protein CEUSTIGMA_g12659.t1 [Chlamydomonas eustigma]|eukprot:GAX85239.1 hypothetical protein CEUSTIGMA_g12659.t1 [Chlamydomonas eustigma]